MQLFRKRLATYALAVLVLLTSPTWAFALAYGPTSINGLDAAVSPNQVILRWFVDVAEKAQSANDNLLVMRSQAGANNYATIATIPCPEGNGSASMSYTDTPTAGQYDYLITLPNRTTNSNVITVSVTDPASGGTGGVVGPSLGGSNQNTGLHPSIYTDDQWRVIMFWYIALTSIGGAFLLFAVLRSGYGYMAGGINPGVRASFIEDVQRMIIAMGIIAAAPAFVFILSLVNDQFVNLFATVLNAFVGRPIIDKPILSTAVGMFERIIASPFNAIISILKFVFGVESIDTLVFNGQTGTLFRGLLGDLSTGNPIGDVVLNGALTAFTVYFNAIYSIRKWILTVNLVATPIIAWVWAISAERQIIEIWVAEIIMTIFMQASQALSFGVLGSILVYAGGALAANSTNVIVNQLIVLGLFIGGFAGSIGMLVIMYNGFKLVLNTGGDDGKKRSEALQGIGKAIIGMIIVGLAMSIAGFLAWLLSGNWGVNM